MLATADSGASSVDQLDHAIATAEEALLATRKPDGHFVFELEADVSITAEYVLYRYHLGLPLADVLRGKIAGYLRARQTADDGWPLLHGEAFNLSSSVKAYFALRLCGDELAAPHMMQARTAILAKGGAEKSNVSTRGLLALYGEVPWSAVPMMPVEIMLLPRWFPFHLDKVSFWARTMVTPMLVINALRPRAKNPGDVHIAELFRVPAGKVRRWPGGTGQSQVWTAVFAGLDRALRMAEPLMPRPSRRRAIGKAEAFVRERLNGTSGLGAIYPAMAHAVIMYAALGRSLDDPIVAQARDAVERLVVEHDDFAYVQPCVSPVWDTALASHALMSVDAERHALVVDAAMDWLAARQILDVRGDWSVQRPNLRPGGWAFQYASPHYPDLDDTAAVVMAIDWARRATLSSGCVGHDTAIARGREWVEGLQSSNGGWGAYDVDNDHDYLNNIPFADHGALLDPPTADVTARCVSMLAQLGEASTPAVERALAMLDAAQEKDGSWFGRWGLNYIYGTWSVLCALKAASVGANAPSVRRAVAWLETIQNPDGGWGEDAASYDLDRAGHRPAPSTASQTAWAVLALMAGGAIDHPAVRRGIDYLVATQGRDGFWDEPQFTATGFPRVLYLRYHGYARYFPLWAMARFRAINQNRNFLVATGL